MDDYWQGIGLVILAVLMITVMGSRGKDISFLIIAASCCLVGGLIISYLRPVITFVENLQKISGFDTELLRILLKAVGIGLISEIAAMICTDSGNGALGKMLQMLSAAAILWISLPALERFFELVEDLLGQI